MRCWAPCLLAGPGVAVPRRHCTGPTQAGGWGGQHDLGRTSPPEGQQGVGGGQQQQRDILRSYLREEIRHTERELANIALAARKDDGRRAAEALPEGGGKRTDEAATLLSDPSVRRHLKSKARALRLETAELIIHGDEPSLGHYGRAPDGSPFYTSPTLEGDVVQGGPQAVQDYTRHQAEQAAEKLRNLNEDAIEYTVALATLKERGMDVSGLFDTPGCPCPFTVFLHLAAKHASGEMSLGDRDVGTILSRLADELLHLQISPPQANDAEEDLLLSKQEELKHAYSMRDICLDSGIDFMYESHSALLKVCSVCGDLQKACEVFEEIVGRASEADYGYIMHVAHRSAEHEFVLELFDEARGRFKSKALNSTSTTGLSHPLVVKSALNAYVALRQYDTALQLAEAHLGVEFERFRFKVLCHAGKPDEAFGVLQKHIAMAEGPLCYLRERHSVPLLEAYLAAGDLPRAVEFLEELVLDTRSPQQQQQQQQPEGPTPPTPPREEGGEEPLRPGRINQKVPTVFPAHFATVLEHIVACLPPGSDAYPDAGAGAGTGAEPTSPETPDPAALLQTALSLWGVVAELVAEKVASFSLAQPAACGRVVGCAELVTRIMRAVSESASALPQPDPALQAFFRTELLKLHESVASVLRGIPESLQGSTARHAAVDNLVLAATHVAGPAGLHLTWLLVYGRQAGGGSPGAMQLSALHDSIPDTTYCRLLLLTAGSTLVPLREAMLVHRSIRTPNSLAHAALSEALQRTADTSIAFRLLSDVHTRLEVGALGPLLGAMLRGTACTTVPQVAHSVRGLGRVAVLSSLDVLRASPKGVLQACNKVLVPFSLLTKALALGPSGGDEVRAVLSLPYVDVIRVSEHVMAHAAAEANGIAGKFDLSLVTHRCLCYAWFLGQASQGLGVAVSVLAPPSTGNTPSGPTALAEELGITLQRVPSEEEEGDAGGGGV